jgi:abortive infection bacteriophage resistance protein
VREHLTFQQQLDLLKRRGLTINNDDTALRHLEQIGGYRLKAYLRPLFAAP